MLEISGSLRKTPFVRFLKVPATKLFQSKTAQFWWSKSVHDSETMLGLSKAGAPAGDMS